MKQYCNGFYTENDLTEILQQINDLWDHYGENKGALSKSELQDICDDLNILGGKLCMIGADLFADKEAAYMTRKREQAELTENLTNDMSVNKAERQAVIQTLEQQLNEVETARISKLAYNIYAIAIPNLANSIARRIKMLHEQSPERQEWRNNQVREENEAVMTSDTKNESMAYSTGKRALSSFGNTAVEPPESFKKALRKQRKEEQAEEAKADPVVSTMKKIKIK